MDTSPAAPPRAIEGGARLAMILVATPLLCAAAGLVVLFLLRQRAAGLAAEYAAQGLLPWPGAGDWRDGPASFLHRAEPTRAVLVRNPAGWGPLIAGASFALVPLLLMLGTAAVLLRRHHLAAFALLGLMAGLALVSAPTIRMIAAGHTVVLDAPGDALLLNGRRLAALSDVVRIRTLEHRRSRGARAWTLTAVLRAGPDVEIGGPHDRPDLVAVGPALEAVRRRLRGEPAAPPRGAPGRGRRPEAALEAIRPLLRPPFGGEGAASPAPAGQGPR